MGDDGSKLCLLLALDLMQGNEFQKVQARMLVRMLAYKAGKPDLTPFAWLPSERIHSIADVGMGGFDGD